jgi:hypothetical protein
LYPFRTLTFRGGGGGDPLSVKKEAFFMVRDSRQMVAEMAGSPYGPWPKLIAMSYPVAKCALYISFLLYLQSKKDLPGRPLRHSYSYVI